MRDHAHAHATPASYTRPPTAISPRLTSRPHTSPGTHFYIIVEGEVVITKAGQKEPLARRTAGDYFGELSLKTGAPTIASVSAAGPTTKLVRMDRGAFQRLLGPLDSLLALRKYTAGGVEVSASVTRASQNLARKEEDYEVEIRKKQQAAESFRRQMGGN